MGIDGNNTPVGRRVGFIHERCGGENDTCNDTTTTLIPQKLQKPQKTSTENVMRKVQTKKKPVRCTGFFMNRVSDDVLLSRARAHYHRRKSVSRSCSGWEGVVPLRYGRQTKLVGGEPSELPRLAAVV